MITNETILHDPPIGLGYMDDSMQMTGPTEEDTHFINDTGSSEQDMKDMVDAYQSTQLKYDLKLVSMGGWNWMLTRGEIPKIRNNG